MTGVVWGDATGYESVLDKVQLLKGTGSVGSYSNRGGMAFCCLGPNFFILLFFFF